jgi:phosphoserine phosphatase RsbU/P
LNPPDYRSHRRATGLAPWLLIVIMTAALTISERRAAAQIFDGTNLRVPAELGATGVTATGDDPSFARPDFDDSKWFPIDDKRPMREFFPHSQPPVIWQRAHVKVSPNETGLAIEAYGVGPAFEIFVNGQKLLESGRVNPLVSYTEYARLVARIPDAQIATGNLVIAVRGATRPSWWKPQSDVTFWAGMIVLGQETALTDIIRLNVIYSNAFTWLVELAGFGLNVVALALFLAQRQQKEYLWLAIQGVAAFELPFLIAQSLRNLPAGVEYIYPLASTILDFFTVLMLFAFVRRRFTGWLRTYIVVCFLLTLSVGWASVYGVVLPSYAPILFVPLSSLFVFVIPALLIARLRNSNRGETILLIPVSIWAMNNALNGAIALMVSIPGFREAGIRLANQTQTFPVGPFTVNTGMATGLIGYISLTIIIVLRSTQTSRQQTLLEGQVAAAREVQQVILPEQIEAIPGFNVESVYKPAQQVGGDFFQILPAGEDGLLLVLGDVAGKGLPAAMLVSVLVGAIRTLADYTITPDEILAKLNERLIGRSRGGFSTALAAYFRQDGAVSIANAGHLSPYLDGCEVELAGALPLGIASGAVYETTRFQLAAGSRLTFYSDGVIEAQNEKGELFGFERGREISMQPATAIVEAAKKFGQSDDITVVTIDRVPTAAGDVLVSPQRQSM